MSRMHKILRWIMGADDSAIEQRIAKAAEELFDRMLPRGSQKMWLCLDCDIVFRLTSREGQCPVCLSDALMKARVVNDPAED